MSMSFEALVLDNVREFGILDTVRALRLHGYTPRQARLYIERLTENLWFRSGICEVCAAPVPPGVMLCPAHRDIAADDLELRLQAIVSEARTTGGEL